MGPEVEPDAPLDIFASCTYVLLTPKLVRTYGDVNYVSYLKDIEDGMRRQRYC